MESDIVIYKKCPTCPNLGMCSKLNDVKLRRSLCPFKHGSLDADGQENVKIKDYTKSKYKFRKGKAKKKAVKRKTKDCGCA